MFSKLLMFLFHDLPGGDEECRTGNGITGQTGRTCQCGHGPLFHFLRDILHPHPVTVKSTLSCPRCRHRQTAHRIAVAQKQQKHERRARRPHFLPSLSLLLKKPRLHFKIPLIRQSMLTAPRQTLQCTQYVL